MANGFVVNLRSLDRRMTGVERYVAELACRSGGRLRRVSPTRPIPAMAGHLWEQAVLPARLERGEMLWSPANTGPLAVEDQVLTLHDASVLEHPGWYHPLFAGWYRVLLPRLVRRVRQVLTGSEFSRQRILKIFGLDPAKVSVIPAGVDLERFCPASPAETNRVRQRYRLPENYLLFVGTLEPRKNLGRLYAAWQRLQPGLPGVGLAIAGSPSPNLASLGPRPDMPSLCFLGYVDDNDLPGLYSGAVAYLLPSLEEGFGLTALEAMACGTPVIASNTGALPETVGEAGILASPLETEAWVGAIACLLADRDLWLEFSRRGRERARRFSWEETSGRVWQALEAASGE